MFSSAVLDLLILIHFILFLNLKTTIQPLAFWMYLTLTSYDLKKKNGIPTLPKEAKAEPPSLPLILRLNR